MGKTRNLPRKRGPGDLDVFKAMCLARGELQRLGRHQHGCKTGARCSTEMLLHCGARRTQVDVANDHDHQIVWSVAFAIIGREVVARNRREYIAMSDDGVLV